MDPFQPLTFIHWKIYANETDILARKLVAVTKPSTAVVHPPRSVYTAERSRSTAGPPVVSEGGCRGVVVLLADNKKRGALATV